VPARRSWPPDKPVRRRIGEAVDALAAGPRPAAAKMITGAHGVLRIRVGVYRVLYTIDEGQLVVLVLDAGLSARSTAGDSPAAPPGTASMSRQPALWPRCSTRARGSQRGWRKRAFPIPDEPSHDRPSTRPS
jgi:mRNA-degrading endonuclease RelE of RelBE toxin-antitoxin system